MRYKKIIFNTIFVLAGSLILSVFFYISQPVKTKKNIIIPSGDSKSVISYLAKKGYDVGIIDVWLLKFIGKPLEGRVYIPHTLMNRLEFLKRLVSKSSHYKIITLIPGETTVIFVKQLAYQMNKDAKKLLKLYYLMSPYKEAGILADSYNVPIVYSEKRIMSYLINLTESRYKALATKYFGRYDKDKWQKILVIASIIQKEAANKKEMPIVASVIYNRLKKRMRLQMDGTLNYGKYSHIKVTPQRIKSDNTSYNTYKHRGLPNRPVCNVSIDAINAALNPAKTDYLYFFRNSRGEHDFFSTYKSHLKEVQKRRKELNR